MVASRKHDERKSQYYKGITMQILLGLNFVINILRFLDLSYKYDF